MRSPSIVICSLTTVMLLGGCVRVSERISTKSAYHLVIPAAADSYTIDENQEFLLGDRIGTTILPEYPTSELSRHLPEQVVCVEIDIDTDGHVFSSRPMYSAPGCPAQDHHPGTPFYIAAEKAVAQWVFGPARICTFPDRAAKNEVCQGRDVKIEYVPIHLAFLFSFTQERGPHVISRTLDQQK